MDAHNGKSSGRTGGWTGTHIDVIQSHKSYFSSFCWFIGSLRQQQQQPLQASTVPPSNKYRVTAPHVWWHFSVVFTFNQHLILGKHIFCLGWAYPWRWEEQKRCAFSWFETHKIVRSKAPRKPVFESNLSFIALSSDKFEWFRQGINSLRGIRMLF